MNINKISILFLIAKSRINSLGKCSIRCRITYEQKRYEFATGLFINPNYWNAQKQKALPPNTEHNQVNTQLSLIKQNINQAFLFLQVQEKNFDVDDIYRQYKGENIKEDKSIMEVFNLHIAKNHQYHQQVYFIIIRISRCYIFCFIIDKYVHQRFYPSKKIQLSQMGTLGRNAVCSYLRLTCSSYIQP